MFGFGSISEFPISETSVVDDQIFVEYQLDSSFYEEPDFNDVSTFDYYCDNSVINNSIISIVQYIISSQDWNLEEVDLDESLIYEFYQAQAPPTDNEVSFDTKAEFPSQSEEPEDEDYSFIGYQVGVEVAAVADQIYQEFPIQEEQPEDEDYGNNDYNIGTEVAVITDQVVCIFPHHSEEHEDEDYGFVDYQIDVAVQDQVFSVFPAHAEEHEDEDFGFVDSQLPPDNEISFDVKAEFHLQVEDQHDEDFGFTDYQIGIDVASDLSIIWPYDASEQQEENESDYEFRIQYDKVFDDVVSVSQPVGGMIGGKIRRKRKVVINGQMLILDDKQLREILMLEVKKLPITPKVLTEKKKKSKTTAKLVESYFPAYKELSDSLDTKTAKLLKEMLNEEVKRFEEEEFMLLVMLKLWI